MARKRKEKEVERVRLPEEICLFTYPDWFLERLDRDKKKEIVYKMCKHHWMTTFLMLNDDNDDKW